MSAVQLGYKKTEIGTIPEDWSCRVLGEFCVAYAGGTPATSIRDYYGGDIPWITSSDLNQGNIESVSGRITPLGLENSSAKMVNPNSLLIALYGATAGTTAITRISGAINQAVLAIIPKSGSTTFIYQYLRLKKDWLIKTFTQGGQPNLSGEIIKSLIIPFPDESEQSSIASALSEMDSLISGLDQLIAKKRDIQQAAMQKLLTGQRRLPGFSGEWEVKKLGDLVARITNGCVYTSDEKTGVPITRIETISDGNINWERVGYAKPCPEIESYKIQYGDILYSHINSIDHIGKVARYSDSKSLYHGMNLILLRPASGVDSDFLFRLLGSERIRRIARVLAKQAVSQASINTKELRELDLTIPSFDEQTAIAAILSDMDTELAALEARRDKARQVKQGMRQELLTGKIRLG
ncbi:MAG TPA: hypothetical protein DIC61_04595 [Pseudomonas sp.]|nr:hypothetical protein [Pseudomonas sp.]